MRDFNPLFSLAKKIGDAFLHFFKTIFPCLFDQRPHNPISRSVTTSTDSSMPPLSFSPLARTTHQPPIPRSDTTTTYTQFPGLSFSPTNQRQLSVPLEQSDTDTSESSEAVDAQQHSRSLPNLQTVLNDTESHSSESPDSRDGVNGALTHSRSDSDLPKLFFQGQSGGQNGTFSNDSAKLQQEPQSSPSTGGGAGANGLHHSKSYSDIDRPQSHPQQSPGSENFSPVHSHTLQQQIEFANFSHSKSTRTDDRPQTLAGAGSNGKSARPSISSNGSTALSTQEKYLLEVALRRKRELEKTDSDDESSADSVDFLADHFVENGPTVPAGAGTRQVYNDKGSQQVDITGLEKPRKKKKDLLTHLNKKVPFEPYEVVAKSLPMQHFSSGIYCALQSVNRFWDLILTDMHAITEDTIKEIVESGMKHSSDSSKPEEFLQDFPRMSHIDFTKMENEEEDNKRNELRVATLLREDGQIYGNTYARRVLQRIEEVHAMADKHPQRIGAAIFLKGAADAPEPFVIFAHRPLDSLEREQCHYFIFDLGTTANHAVFKKFKTRAGLRDYIVARAPVESAVDPIKGTVDQTNDYTRIFHVKCN